NMAAEKDEGNELDTISYLMDKMCISEPLDSVNSSVQVTIEEMDRILDRDLFPTLNDIDSPEDRNYMKLLNLGAMVVRIAEYMAGLRQLDNRDLWSNKRLESAGRAMEQYFRILWGHMIKKAVEKVLLARYVNNNQIKSSA